MKHEIRSWKSFKRLFKREFLSAIQEDDILDELKARTQSKGEKISTYLTSLRYITGHLKYPLNEEKFLRTVYKGLTPEYRRQLLNSDVRSLAKLERVLRRYERVKDLDQRYTPPPSKDKMRIPSAAPKGTTKSVKVDALS